MPRANEAKTENCPLDEIDRKLLTHLQSEFPLVPEPYVALGKRLGIPAAEVMSRIGRLRAGRYLRQISALFDARRLGYQSTLVAMKLPPDRVEAGAAIINRHPGVSHNYQRTHAYNLWFTLTVPPFQNLNEEVEHLAKAARPERTLLLPAVKVFKIGVHLDLTGRGETTQRTYNPPPGPAFPLVDSPRLCAEEINAVRALQQDLPLVPRPFHTLAQTYGTTEARLLAQAREFLRRGLMRRFAAVLNHRRAGFRANALGVWRVPEEQVDEVGAQMASFVAVSHCYQRPTYPDWPYSLFTMIHARRSEECHAVAAAISRFTGIADYELLFSTKEYKKVRVQYFRENVDADELDKETLGR